MLQPFVSEVRLGETRVAMVAGFTPDRAGFREGESMADFYLISGLKTGSRVEANNRKGTGSVRADVASFRRTVKRERVGKRSYSRQSHFCRT